MILAIDMAPQASMGYVVPVQNIAEGNVSFSNAHEVKSTPYLATYKDWVFSIGGAADANVYKYIRNDDGTLTKAGQIQIDRMAPMVGNMLVVNETKAYASAPVENKIVIFNPTTMERTGEIDLVDTKWGVDGSNTPNPIGLFLRDDILYVGLGQFENMPICKKGAHILLVDTKTDKPIKKIVDYRLSSATVIGVGGMFVDEKNDLYIPCCILWLCTDQYCGLLRIKNGETDFDRDYCFNLTDRTWQGVEEESCNMYSLIITPEMENYTSSVIVRHSLELPVLTTSTTRQTMLSEPTSITVQEKSLIFREPMAIVVL